MEGVVFAGLFGGMAGVVAGLVCSGFWEAFCLVTTRIEPTQEQVFGLAMGGGCTGVVLAMGLLTLVVTEVLK